MKSKYFAWIEKHYPTPESATLQCKEASLKMAKRFSELKRVRGMVHVKEPHGLPPTKSPHFWLIAEDNSIVDPVVHQYPLGVVKYVPINETLGDPTGKCMNCGDFCYKGYNVCSKKCARAMEPNIDLIDF